MKHHLLSVALLLSINILSICNNIPHDGPMNAQWFYAQENPYKDANELLQNQKWQDAEEKYTELLNQNIGSEYDKNMAELNRASCQTAQRKKAPGWKAFDPLMGIKPDKLLPSELSQAKKGSTVLIHTDKIGIGDIFHFERAAYEFSKKGYRVIISMRPFLMNRFYNVVSKYGKLISEKDEKPTVDFETTLPGLFGHLDMNPAELCPNTALYTVEQEAINKINQLVNPILQNNKNAHILFCFLGENRSATLMGGKQLPHDPAHHGRHLDSESFNSLLKNNPHLHIIDCGIGGNTLTVEESLKHRCQLLPKDKGFDTFVAAALVMNRNKQLIAMGADNGPTNVFARSLDLDAQKRMGIIVPNSKERDMRMNGNTNSPEYKKYAFGERYQQMLSRCLVYKCNIPEDQAQIVATAYQELINNGKEKGLLAKLVSLFSR